MNNSFWINTFEAVAESVLWLAGLVREPFVPGLIVTVLLLGLLIFVVFFMRWGQDRLRAVLHVRKLIIGDSIAFDSDDVRLLRTDFYERHPLISQKIGEYAQNKSSTAKQIDFAWREYRETLKIDSDSKALLNGIRPSVFFNTEDLDAEARGWRIVPGIFVSVGLAATFLGLIAALQQTGDTLSLPAIGVASQAGTAGALQQLLVIASAKFIMSLTGLVCSIVCTIVLRLRLGKLEHAIDMLCMDIEKRVGFIALESLAFDQKKLAEEQKEHSQKLNTELIAAIGRSLNDELPKAISASIGEAMAPMMTQMGQAGTEGVREMVGDLASQFSGDISKAMNEAAERFEGAAHQVESLADVLRSRADDAQGSMEKSISQLSLTIGEMKTELTDGAIATKSAFESGSADVLERMNFSMEKMNDSQLKASQDQREVAGLIADSTRSFAEHLDKAGEDAGRRVGVQLDSMGSDVSEQLTQALQPLLEQAKVLSQETSDQVVRPIKELTSTLDGFVSRLEQGSSRIEGLSIALVKGTDAASQSADVLSSASGSLKLAADPVAILARGLTTTARATAEAATGMAASLDSQQEVLRISTESLEESLEKFQDVIERYDDLDEKLGDAFTEFREQVDASIQRIGEHSDGVHEKYADALNVLQSVVDQAVPFQPTIQS